MPEVIAPATVTSKVPLRTLNLFVLHKLYLSTDSPAPGILEIAERHVGLHAKRPQTPYLTVQARLPGFTRGQLDQLIYEERGLLRTHCMRGTVHLLPLSQYRTVLAATSGQLDGMYRRAFSHLENKDEIESAIVEVIEQRGPLSHTAVAAALPFQVDERDLYRLINELCTRGILIKSTVVGSWRSNVYNYELLRRWQPAIPEGETDRTRAQAQLVERYLAAYAPASLADISWWTGLSQAQVKKNLTRMTRRPISVDFEALGYSAYILEDQLGQLEAWKPPRETEVLFLPAFDPYIVAYIQRERMIDPGRYNQVFRGIAGLIEPVILADGRIIGTWKYKVEADQPRFELFEKPTRRGLQNCLESAARRMAAFLVEADSDLPDAGESELDEE